MDGKTGHGNHDTGWLKNSNVRQADKLEKLYAFLQRRVLPRVRSYLPRRLDEEDLLQDTALAVWQALPKLRDTEKLLPYSLRVARHIISRWRRESTHYTSLNTEEESGYTAVNETNLEREELLVSIEVSLSAEERNLFDLLYMKGAKAPEIQTALGLSAHALAMRKSRLHQRLREIVIRHEK